MKNAIVALAVVIGVAANAAEKFALQPVSISGGKEDAAATPGEVVTVKARGVGANKVEALKDAYRDAVERAVGLYVDAEQQVKNDAVLTDEVLTQSNAYIQSYEIVKEANENGMFQVRILAKVKRTALTARLTEVMPAQTVNVGIASRNLHAEVVTETKMQDDALALIQKEFSDFDPVKQLLVVKLGSAKAEVERIDGESDNVRLWYPIDVTVDEDKYYNTFVPRIERLFDQVKDEPAKRVDFKNDTAFHPQIVKKRMLKKLYFDNDSHVHSHTESMEDAETCHQPLRCSGVALNEKYEDMRFLRVKMNGRNLVLGGLMYDHNLAGECRNSLNGAKYSGILSNPKFIGNIKRYPNTHRCFVVLIKRSVGGASYAGSLYHLPDDGTRAILDWMYEYANWDHGGTIEWPCPERSLTKYVMKFTDANGMGVCETTIELRNPDLYNFGSVLIEDYREMPELYMMVTPLVGGCARRYRKWVSVDIAKDDIAKIASVTIELAD